MSRQKADKRDTVWVGPELPSGRRPFIRDTSQGPQKGMLVPREEEADIVLELEHVRGPFFEVVGETRTTTTGPSQVANQAYRDGWSRIFGGKPAVGQA